MIRVAGNPIPNVTGVWSFFGTYNGQDAHAYRFNSITWLHWFNGSDWFITPLAGIGGGEIMNNGWKNIGADITNAYNSSFSNGDIAVSGIPTVSVEAVSSSIEVIEKTLIKILLDAFPSWLDRIAWPNVVFTPTEAQPWFSYHFLSSQEMPVTLGPDGNDEVNGIIQIDVNYPLNAGEADSRETINALRTCFHPQTISTYGQPVTILSRNKSGGSSENNFYRIPFTVRWKAQLARNT